MRRVRSSARRGDELRARVIRCVFLLRIVLAILAPVPRLRPVQAPNPAGNLEQVDGVSIIHLQGDPHEMGLQQGTLLRDSLREPVRDYLYGHIIADCGASHFGLLNQARLLEKAVPDDLRREMQGVAEGANLSYQNASLCIAPQSPNSDARSYVGVR